MNPTDPATGVEMSLDAAAEAEAEIEAPHRTKRVLFSVLWSWSGVAISLVSGFFLSPYIVRKLGDEGYGVWTLVFSLVEYCFLFDLGFRSATVKFTAHSRAVGDFDEVNRVINTGLAYFAGVALLLLLGTLTVARFAGSLFKISASYQSIFAYLITMVGISLSMSVIFVVFEAVLEAYQRFDLSSRISITSTALRTVGSFVLLAMGYRIIALGLMVMSSQLLGYILNFVYMRRVFPQLRFSFSYINLKTMRQMWGYGVHTAVASLSERLLNQNPNLLIGHFRPSAEVGYFSVPLRLLQYVAEAVYRVGSVTSSNTAELCARGETEKVARFGTYANRYCLTLFLPLGIFLWVYGGDFIRVWMNPEFARRTTVILPMLTVAYEFAIAGQFNSSSILFGLGKHRGYSRTFLAEMLLGLAGLYLLIPIYGINGAGWVTAVLMVANRGLIAPWLVCHHLRYSFTRYMMSIYVRPLLAAIPVFFLTVFSKQSWLPGVSRIQIGEGALLIGIIYYAIAYLICLEPEHRKLLRSTVEARLKPMLATIQNR